jgi:hypothetical protein
VLHWLLCINWARAKGYAFIGCNSAGNNAYFVRQDKLGKLQAVSLQHGYVESKFRESRDRSGNLNYLRAQQRLQAIAGLSVVNVATGNLSSCKIQLWRALR